MSGREYAHLFREISNRAFILHEKDLDTLKNRFGRIEVDISRIVVSKMKRKQLVNAILAYEFGSEAVMDYISQCNEWDEMKKAVERQQ